MAKRYRSRNANALVARITAWTIHCEARLGAVETRRRLMAAPLADNNRTASGPRPCDAVSCGFPEMTWGCAISAAQQHGVGVNFRYRGRLVEPVTAVL